MNDIFADAAQNGSAYHAESSRSHDDHRCLFLIRRVDDDLAGLAYTEGNTATDVVLLQMALVFVDDLSALLVGLLDQILPGVRYNRQQTLLTTEHAEPGLGFVSLLHHLYKP